MAVLYVNGVPALPGCNFPTDATTCSDPGCPRCPGYMVPDAPGPATRYCADCESTLNNRGECWYCNQYGPEEEE